MKLVLYTLLFLLCACDSPVKETESKIVLGYWEVKKDMIAETSFQLDTIQLGDSIFIDNYLFPRYLVDSIIINGKQLYSNEFEFSKIEESEVIWNNKKHQAFTIFLANYAQSYYLLFVYVEEFGVIIKNYSHSKYLLKKIINNKDTIYLDSLAEKVLDDTILFPPPPPPPPLPPIIE